MTIWYDRGAYECAKCNAIKPAAKQARLKAGFGCTAQPTAGDGLHKFPVNNPRATIDRCPVRYISDRHDIIDIIRAVNLSDSKLTITEQESLPAPYLDAYCIARHEISEVRVASMKKANK